MSQIPSQDMIMTVIIAARNEQALIGDCLDALLAQNDQGPVEVIVAANACTDQTVAIAQAKESPFSDRRWSLVVLDLPDGGKLGALNAAERQATGDCRIYLDADVLCDPALLAQLRDALATSEPRYATGTLVVAEAKTWVTRAYAKIWQQTPFVKSGAVGAGLFAVNVAGRARWGTFPDIISDDTFVRVNFKPDERIEVPATYVWPMVEGLRNLIKVRRRQDIGVAEINERFPELIENEGKSRLGVNGLLRLMAYAPVGFAVYMIVHVLVRFGKRTTSWTRGR